MSPPKFVVKNQHVAQKIAKALGKAGKDYLEKYPLRKRIEEEACGIPAPPSKLTK